MAIVNASARLNAAGNFRATARLRATAGAALNAVAGAGGGAVLREAGAAHLDAGATFAAAPQQNLVAAGRFAGTGSFGYYARVFASGGFGGSGGFAGAARKIDRGGGARLAASGSFAADGQVWRPFPYAEHLLPSSASHLTRALSAAARRIQSIPVPIDLMKRPLDVPVQYLPHLAFEYSVDLWSKAWPEDKRRAITQAAILLHQKKGSLYALKEYVRYAGGAVLDVERPPMKVFSGRSITKAEREAWLSTLPQIRLWQIRDTGTAPLWKAFLGGKSSSRQHDAAFCLGGPAPTPSIAPTHLNRRARWIENGIETDTKVANIGTTYQIYIKADAGDRVFCNDPIGGAYFIPSDAWKRIVTIAPATRLAWRSPVTPTLQAVISEPEHVVVDGDAGASVFCDEPLFDCYFVPTTAPMRIYERYPVLGPDTTSRSPVVQFMGVGRYGFPAHTAHVSASMPGTRSDVAAGDGAPGAKRFWIPHDPQPMIDLCTAADASKRLSDKVMLRTGPEPRFIAGGRPLLAGIDTLIVGQP